MCLYIAEAFRVINMPMKTLLRIAFFVFSLNLWIDTSVSAKTWNRPIDGYPLSNFALTAHVSQEGDMFGRIWQNNGILGEWLVNKGGVYLSIQKDQEEFLLSDFPDKKINRSFPFVSAEYGNHPKIKSAISARSWIPSGVNNLAVTTLPAIQVEFTVLNLSSGTESFSLVWQADSLFRNDVKEVTGTSYKGVADDNNMIASNFPVTWNGDKHEIRIPITVKRGEEKKICVAIVLYDKTWVTANTYDSVESITQYLFSRWGMLRAQTENFDRSIPSSGDTEVDQYLRWYMIPGMALTKCTKNGEIVTLGYRELNQRDSYWASWLHLVLFRDAERKMIEESIAHQAPSGKIPTTILPLIERNDDIDINAFFILRVQRYARYYKDRDLIAQNWNSLKKAADWLISRDVYGDGLPAQKSFWGDWKDVSGVEGRKYSPFSGMMYLASLKKMIALSREMNDQEAQARYQAAYDKGYEFINTSDKEGGLWNGNFYRQQWYDNRMDDKLLQDQTVGILFGVIPRDRAEKIVESLNTRSLTEYGICETYPYYPAEFGYEPATYHNGAVWPWLSFVDVWGRLELGRRAEAFDLIKRVAYSDLVASGDWSANEHINSLTGQNLGFQLQGWNAGLFGVVFFGMNYLEIFP